MYTAEQIAEITNCQLIGKNQVRLRYFLNDSRELQFPDESLFVALKSDWNDGHRYIPELIEKGVKAFLVADMGFDFKPYAGQDLCFLLCESPLHTLQQLAAYHRQRFNIPVIGITGSNGKTMVKEWLYQLLKNKYSICRSPKSYNSQIGVPLSVLNLNENHTLAIFEAGISKPGEMEHLASIIRPTLGVFTSIGSAHDEGFDSRQQKITEKAHLFLACETVLANGLRKTDLNNPGLNAAILVSENEEADWRLSHQGFTFELKSKNKTLEFNLPYNDKASVNNAATCALVMLQLGFNEKEIQSGLSQLQSLALRLELKKGIDNSLLINDFYNSDLDSIAIALSYLNRQAQNTKKVLVISDIEQSGMSTEQLYGLLAGLLAQNKIDLLLGIGPEISEHKHLFPSHSAFFLNTNDFVAQFSAIRPHFTNTSVLLKGARSFGFEKIAALLQLKSHDTVFEINLNKLQHNFSYYRSLLQPGVKIMGMVKAMAYGSGSSEIALALQHMGAGYLAVAYADEGVELRKSQITLPILVMNPEEAAFEDIINYRLEPEIFSFRVLRNFIKTLDALGITEAYPIHLKIDTGMHRLGFLPEETESLINEIKSSYQIKIRSVFSHLAASDNPHLDDFTELQIKRFETSCKQLEAGLGYAFLKHLCNSSGITRFKAAHFDMVRLGIGLYGIGSNEKEQQLLENVGTLKTKISQIKSLEAGESVSYNRSGQLNKKSRIAVIPIGYADGFSRLLGNGKHGVYINKQFCKTIGNICMDMSMIDVSDCTCEEGDEVIIFENPEQIHALAKALGSIPYEVLTNVSGRVKRVYVRE